MTCRRARRRRSERKLWRDYFRDEIARAKPDELCEWCGHPFHDRTLRRYAQLRGQPLTRPESGACEWCT